MGRGPDLIQRYLLKGARFGLKHGSYSALPEAAIRPPSLEIARQSRFRCPMLGLWLETVHSGAAMSCESSSVRLESFGDCCSSSVGTGWQAAALGSDCISRHLHEISSPSQHQKPPCRVALCSLVPRMSGNHKWQSLLDRLAGYLEWHCAAHLSLRLSQAAAAAARVENRDVWSLAAHCKSMRRARHILAAEKGSVCVHCPTNTAWPPNILQGTVTISKGMEEQGKRCISFRLDKQRNATRHG